MFDSGSNCTILVVSSIIVTLWYAYGMKLRKNVKVIMTVDIDRSQFN